MRPPPVPTSLGGGVAHEKERGGGDGMGRGQARERVATGTPAAQWDALYSVHYVFICAGDVFDPFPLLTSFGTLPLLFIFSFFSSLHSFYFFLLGSNFSVLNGGGS